MRFIRGSPAPTYLVNTFLLKLPAVVFFVGHILHCFIIVFRSLHLLQLARCIGSHEDPEAYIAASLTLTTLLKVFMIQAHVIFFEYFKISFFFGFYSVLVLFSASINEHRADAYFLEFSSVKLE